MVIYFYAKKNSQRLVYRFAVSGTVILLNFQTLIFAKSCNKALLLISLLFILYGFTRLRLQVF